MIEDILNELIRHRRRLRMMECMPLGPATGEADRECAIGHAFTLEQADRMLRVEVSYDVMDEVLRYFHLNGFALSSDPKPTTLLGVSCYAVRHLKHGEWRIINPFESESVAVCGGL